MNSKGLVVLSFCLLLIVWAECQKEKPSKATEKKVMKAMKGRETKVSKATGKKAQQEAPKFLKKGQAKPTTAASRQQQPPFILTRAVARGQFQKVPDTLVLRAGDTLDLRCKGRAIKWRYPPYLEDDEVERRLRIKRFERHSQLIVVNSTAADTGEYSCWSFQCHDSECHDGEDKLSKAFIFFTDPQELFVPTEDYYEVIQLRTNHPTLLPCQVTNPVAKVTLHREFPPEKVPVDGIDISYDVKRGFMIHRPRPSHAGSLFCMANVDGVRQISTKYMLIYVNYPSSVPKPTIQSSVASFRVGENFNVTCTAFGEPEIAIDFTWEYPGQQMGRPPYVRERTDLVRRSGQVQQESESILYIDEARAVDDGLYSCIAENLQGTTTVSTRIRLLPATLAPKKAKSG
ncbi:platelet-derived growth factor receptor-like protein [Elgaria multicarinata webbii]|uniref:platelet-derived growth factor receptor-like protein n=1 Tax=Elgaria multicarinata webbii TaxID=159646 RepID=UPI002FCD16BB